MEAALASERAAKRTIISKAGAAVKSMQGQLQEALAGRNVNWPVLAALKDAFADAETAQGTSEQTAELLKRLAEADAELLEERRRTAEERQATEAERQRTAEALQAVSVLELQARPASRPNHL